jgi:hypothetical protein
VLRTNPFREPHIRRPSLPPAGDILQRVTDFYSGKIHAITDLGRILIPASELSVP